MRQRSASLPVVCICVSYTWRIAAECQKDPDVHEPNKSRHTLRPCLLPAQWLSSSFFTRRKFVKPNRTLPSIAGTRSGGVFFRTRSLFCVGVSLPASLNVDIELVTMCSPPLELPQLTMRMMPGPGTADMGGVRGIGGDAIVEAFEWTCSSKCRHPRSNAVSTSSAVTLPFDNGCPELRLPPGEGAFQGKSAARNCESTEPSGSSLPPIHLTRDPIVGKETIQNGTISCVPTLLLPRLPRGLPKMRVVMKESRKSLGT